MEPTRWWPTVWCGCVAGARQRWLLLAVCRWGLRYGCLFPFVFMCEECGAYSVVCGSGTGGAGRSLCVCDGTEGMGCCIALLKGCKADLLRMTGKMRLQAGVLWEGKV